MHTATLDQFIALNDELAALVQAGVPLEVGLGKPPAETAAALEKINVAVARRVSQGASLREALSGDDQAVPPAYRCLVEVGLRSGDVTGALQGYSHLARTVEGSWHVVRQSLLYPLIVACVAYAGVVGLCLFIVPTLDSAYHGLEVAPGWGLHVLQSLRDALPYWVALPPVALLLLFVWQLRSAGQGSSLGTRAQAMSWLPGLSRTIQLERAANFADTLATLLEDGTPLEESLLLAAGASGDPVLDQAARELATDLRLGRMPAADVAAARRFPPFLRWALWHSAPTVRTDRALRMAARMYRDAAQRRFHRLRVVAPIVTCVVLGGGITLLYGLALFVPVVELFRGMAY